MLKSLSRVGEVNSRASEQEASLSRDRKCFEGDVGGGTANAVGL